MDLDQQQRDLADALGTIVDKALDTTPPLLILKILGAICEDLRAVNNRLEINAAFTQLGASLASRQTKPDSDETAPFIT